MNIFHRSGFGFPATAQSNKRQGSTHHCFFGLKTWLAVVLSIWLANPSLAATFAGLSDSDLDVMGKKLEESFMKCPCMVEEHFILERVIPKEGVNPYDPLNPLGGFTPFIPGTPPATPPVTPPVTPPPVTGCTGAPSPSESQTLPCPQGQTGVIIQTRAYACVGATWAPGPYQTTSNTCSTPQTGCATCFGSGAYACSGGCGIGSMSLSVTPGSGSMTAGIFGSNTNTAFSCSASSANSQSASLIILGASGHSCTLSCNSPTSVGIFCRNNSGGTCTSSCSR